MSNCIMTFGKGKSKKLFSRSNKNFDSKLFEETLIKNFSETELFLKSLETTFSLPLENFAPLKDNYLRYNNSPFMNRTVRKAFMSNPKLKRRYNLDRTPINFENYKKQLNFCVNLLRTSKKQYFNNIDVKNVTDNKMFWKTIRPKFWNKCKTANIIILFEDEKILQHEKATTNTFNNYFTDVTHSLGLEKKNIGLENTLSKTVKNFRKFESIKKIKKSQQAAENSSFPIKVISNEEVNLARKYTHICSSRKYMF